MAHAGMIVRQAAPLNLEMPFGALDDFVTGAEDFFVRCHFPIPEIEHEKWRLRVRGAVRRPVEFSWEELRAMPTTTLTATIECAGNGRAFLSPSADGAQWERGAVGNAVWTGVLLKHVLQQAELKPAAAEVNLVGAVHGTIEKTPRPAGEIHYARSLPLVKAVDDVLLAWQMNEHDLTPAHGFPLRAIVPGWYGMAGVKWLSDITVTETPFHGYYQSVDYAYWQRGAGEPALVPITEMQVKEQVARPGPAEVVPAGEPYLVRGAAWSGGAEIVRVEVSVDGGNEWRDARLDGRINRHAWRLWDYEWAVAASPGKATLMARATDARGRTQPTAHDPDRGGYMINEVLRIEVEVR